MIEGRILVSITRSGKRFRAATVNGRPAAPSADLFASLGSQRRRILTFGRYSQVAALAAFDAARRAEMEICDEERREADGGFTERAIMAEALLENLMLLTFKAGDTAKAAVRSEAAQICRQLRSDSGVLYEAVFAFRPEDGVFARAEIAQADRFIEGALRLCGPLLYDLVFEMTPEAFLDDLTTPGDLDSWANAVTQPAAGILMSRLLDEAELFGRIDSALLPETDGDDGFRFADEILHRLIFEPGFDAAPVWLNEPRLTGAVVRHRRHPLIRAMFARSGVTAALLWAARLLDTASLFCFLSGRAVKHAVPPASVFSYAPGTVRGGAAAFAETAGGLLTEAFGYRSDDPEERLFAAVRPADWLYAPEGPAAQTVFALMRGLSRSDRSFSNEAVADAVRLALFPLEAGVPIDIQVRSGSVEPDD